MLTRLAILFLVAVPLFAFQANAQPGASPGDLQRILEKLDRLEQQNAALTAEIRSLREALRNATAKAAEGDAAALAPPPDGIAPPTDNAPGSPTLREQVAIHEARIDELAQTKIGTSQKIPVSLTGMLLFNAFVNGRNGGTLQDPLTAQLTPGNRNSGASLRQTTLGLKFDGPGLMGGGQASGSVYMDFFGGNSDPSGHLFRFRIATFDLAWKNTTFTVGQDKPIVAPREPTSFAQVGISPLTAAGNLWDWRPQVRVEQRFHFTDAAGLRAQAGVYLTFENDITLPAAVLSTLEKYRPGYQGRFEFFHESGDRRFQIAPGFHRSTSHANRTAIPSRIATLDWLAQPNRFVSFTGAWFKGTNTANLGSLRQGFVVSPAGITSAVHSYGGWAQVAVHPTSRMTIDVYGGQQHDRASDLGVNFFPNGGVTRNFTYATNFLYRLAPNIVVALEVSQNRTTYRPAGLRLNNHYDLALAYLF